jgi:hypothetical protein
VGMNDAGAHVGMNGACRGAGSEYTIPGDIR